MPKRNSGRSSNFSSRLLTKERDNAHTSHLSVPSTHDQRWSEVVPPDGALTFVAVYDPEEGLMAFSGAELLPSSKGSPTPSPIPHPRIRMVDPIPTTNTPRRHLRRDNRSSIVARYRQAIVRASSSAFSAMSVYSSDSKRGPRWASSSQGSRSPQWSVFNRLDQEPRFNAQTAFRGFSSQRGRPSTRGSSAYTGTIHDDEGFYESTNGRRSEITDNGAVLVELNLRSAFSDSTMSTANLADLDDVGPARRLTRSISRRFLRKPPPSRAALPPPDVLARLGYISPSPVPPSPCSSSPPSPGSTPDGRFKRFAGYVKRILTRSDDERWVCVDAIQTVTVTQHLVS